MPALPTTMAAVLLEGHGGFDRLRYRTDVPVPRPGPDEVLIRVAASSVNNTDINTRIGWYSQSADDVGTDGSWTGSPMSFPRIQGADVCGRIVAVGSDVDRSRLGRRVIVQSCLRSRRTPAGIPWLGSECDGGFAQYVVAPALDSWDVAGALSDIELACLPCAYATAENLLARAGVRAGEQVLITGATGGVGSAAIQLVLRRGARAIAVAAADKADEVATLGAERVISRDADPRPLLGSDGIDVVIDLVGGANWPALLDLLRPGGRYAVAGAIAGPLVELDLRKLYLKDLTFFGCTTQGDEVFADLVGYAERGEIRPRVARTYPLSAIVEAQQDFIAKKHVGKLVLLLP
jgi:NADPH:quinone reductase-like Zn-dependent oxidoreductase